MKRLSAAFASSLALLGFGSGGVHAQAPDIVGTWHGTSTCVDTAHFPGCQNEEVIYEAHPRPATADTVDLRADKMVNGTREFMGDLVFVRQSEHAWSADFQNARVSIRFEFVITGDVLTGRLLDIPTGRDVRHISVRRVRGN